MCTCTLISNFLSVGLTRGSKADAFVPHIKDSVVGSDEHISQYPHVIVRARQKTRKTGSPSRFSDLCRKYKQFVTHH